MGLQVSEAHTFDTLDRSTEQYAEWEMANDYAEGTHTHRQRISGGVGADYFFSLVSSVVDLVICGYYNYNQRTSQFDIIM